MEKESIDARVAVWHTVCHSLSQCVAVSKCVLLTGKCEWMVWMVTGEALRSRRGVKSREKIKRALVTVKLWTLKLPAKGRKAHEFYIQCGQWSRGIKFYIKYGLKMVWGIMRTLEGNG